ncbi:hypothetical protein J4227_01370 [Candidatus Woesearchaeota archaeon]|nr:hypothetical protein [Candidatus Woesearchaeota archaeon]
MSSTESARNAKWAMLLVIAAIALVSIGLASAQIGDALNSATTGIQGAVAKYKYAGINAAIIAALLLAGAALMEVKEDRYRNMLQLGVVAFAVLLAFMNPDLKANYIWKMGWVSNILHLKVLVNLGLITGFIMVVAQFIPQVKQKMTGKWGNFGIFAVALLIASTIALGPFTGGKPYDEKTYKYIWEQDSLIEIRYYLLGDANCVVQNREGDSLTSGRYCYTVETLENAQRGVSTSYSPDLTTESTNFEGFGILRGRQIFIFIGLSLLVYFFLTSWKIGTDFKLIQWTIAILAGSAIANNGITVKSAVFFGEVLFGLVIYKGMKAQDTFKDKWAWINILFASLLTEWLADLAFEEYAFTAIPFDIIAGLFNGQILTGSVILLALGVAGYIGYSKTDGIQNDRTKMAIRVGIVLLLGAAGWWWFKSGAQDSTADAIAPFSAWVFGGLLFIVAIGAGMATKSGDKAHKENKGWRRIMEDLKRWAWRHVGRGLRGINDPTGRALTKFGLTGGYEPGNTFPLEFLHNREKLFTLMNYLLRLQVFKGKHGAVIQNYELMRKIYGQEGVPRPNSARLGKDTSQNRFRTQIVLFESGPRCEVFPVKKIDETQPLSPTNIDADDFRRRFRMFNVKFMKYKNFYYDEVDGDSKYLNYGNTSNIKGATQTFRYTFSLLQRLQSELTLSQLRTGSEATEVTARATNIKERVLRDFRQSIVPNITGKYKEYIEAMRKYGLLIRVNARRKLVADQYAYCGMYTHTYLMARNSAPVYYFDFTFEKVTGDDEGREAHRPGLNTVKVHPVPVDGIKWREEADLRENLMQDIRRRTSENNMETFRADERGEALEQVEEEAAEEVEELKSVKDRDEVSWDGYFLDDLNEINMGALTGKYRTVADAKEWLRRNHGQPYIRGVKPVFEGDEYRMPTISWFEKFTNPLKYLDIEWIGWIEELRYGTYRGASRTFSDYEHAFLHGDAEGRAFRNVRKAISNGRVEFPDISHPAVDLEYFKNPARYHVQFLGRKRFYETSNEAIRSYEYTTPYPGISTLGISKFLKFYFENTIQDEHIVNEYLSWFVKDSGGPEPGIYYSDESLNPAKQEAPK